MLFLHCWINRPAGYFPASTVFAIFLPGRDQGDFSLPALSVLCWQLNGRYRVATINIVKNKILFVFETPPFRSQLAAEFEVIFSS